MIKVYDFPLFVDSILPHLLYFREDKIGRLCSVMGVRLHDPDRAYELTTDNVKKILAIHMRFRCVLVIPSHVLFAQCGIKLCISIHQVDDGSAK